MRWLACVALLLVACDGSSEPIDPDGLASIRPLSNGAVWGRRTPDGRLATVVGDFPVDDSGDVIGERQILRQLAGELGLDDPDAQTQIFGTVPFFAGGDLTIFWLLHSGVRVAGADIRVLRQGDSIRLVSARIPPRILLDVEPTVTAADAVAGLFEQLGLSMTVPVSEPQLRIWDSAMLNWTGGRPALAWEMNVTGLGLTYVSATSGVLLHAGRGPRHIAVDVSYARASDHWFDFTNPGEHTPWFRYPDGAIAPMSPDAERWDEATRAYADAQAIHGFFDSRFAWTSYDGQDGAIHVFVGQGETCAPGSNCGNAGWMGNEQTNRAPTDEFDEYIYFQAGAYADDIFAHEFTHGVLDHLTRTPPDSHGEPGSVEEHLADMFAAFFDGSDRWTVGEGLGISRRLDAPADNVLNGCPSQPIHLDGRYTAMRGAACDDAEPVCPRGHECIGGACESLSSNGFSHCNASIPSLAGWRMTAGDPSAEIRAIGVAKAQAIYFAALTLVTRFESFEDLYIHLLASCHFWVDSEITPVDAIGPMLPWDCGQLINAFHSVGIARAGDEDLDGWDDIADNCRTTENFRQENRDGDDLGDACDLDLDGMQHCYWDPSSGSDWCIQTNDADLIDGVRIECEGFADFNDGPCPAGGHTCWRVTSSGFYSSTVFYDAVPDGRRERCDGPDETWMNPWVPPEG